MKWDYCVYSVGVIFYLTPGGLVPDKEFSPGVLNVVKGTIDPSREAQALAHLGEEGWEMTGIELSGNAPPRLFFKRRTRRV